MRDRTGLPGVWEEEGERMKKAGIFADIYLTGHEDFVVEIETETNADGVEYGAWIYRQGMGTKKYMFGETGTLTYREFVSLVEANLEDYYSMYDEEVK